MAVAEGANWKELRLLPRALDRRGRVLKRKPASVRMGDETAAGLKTPARAGPRSLRALVGTLWPASFPLPAP